MLWGEKSKLQEGKNSKQTKNQEMTRKFKRNLNIKLRHQGAQQIPKHFQTTADDTPARNPE